MIRVFAQSDARALAEIYNHHVRETVTTFETVPVTPDMMARRFSDLTAAGFPAFVSERNNRIVGYAYAGSWKSRQAYSATVEASVYLAQDAIGHGHGRALYERLLEAVSARGAHAVLAGIALPNDNSVGFHEHLGFEHVGTLREVGWKLGRWVDVGYWERIL